MPHGTGDQLPDYSEALKGTDQGENAYCNDRLPGKLEARRNRHTADALPFFYPFVGGL